MLRSMLFACTFSLALTSAHAATLRAFRAIPGNSVRLSDLFADMATPDRVLGAAPAPGERITVQAPQLAAIARDYGVDWRPVSGAEQTILERASVQFTQDALTGLLRPKLIAAGAPANAAITLEGYAAPALPVGANPTTEIADFTYDTTNFRFTALLTVTTPDAPPAVQKIAGQIVPMVDAATLTHRMAARAILTAQDIRATRIPANALRGEAALSPNAVLGLALRRDTPPGQPLVTGDLTHPILVARNAPVRMVLSAGTMTLAAEGVALEEGSLGAHIRVQNPSSHAVMLAEITGDNEVRIIPGHAPIVVAAQ
jgi:flagellar basal body P-ring formation protein FlgA